VEAVGSGNFVKNIVGGAIQKVTFGVNELLRA